jgi:RNA polymerase sigma-70 factor, ECF subfamily
VSTPLDSPAERAPRAAEASQPSSFDGAAFDALFRGCAADVHAYALALLGDRFTAEDVTALSFERLYRSRSRLDRARGTPRAWLFAIARNATLDELRRRRRHPHLVADEGLAGGEHDAGGAIEHAERRATVRAALATLTPREREVVLLKFHGQLSNGELAQALGISESNAGTRVHRALTHLRENCVELDRKEVA